MFCGTTRAPEGVFFEKLQRAGVRNLNATTSFDRTNYFETVPPNALDLALWLEADRMAHFASAIDLAKLMRERGVVTNELRQNYENAPGGFVREYVNAALFPEGHAYHSLPIGDEAALRRVALDDVRRFHDTYYAPANATLVLVGDFDTRAALASIERTLGAVAPRAQPAVKDAPAPVTLARETRLVVEADVDRPRVVIAYPVMPMYAPGWTELEIGSDALEGAIAYGVLKEEPLGDSVDVTLEGRQLASVLWVSARLKPGVSPDKALAQIERWIHIARAPKFHFDRTRFAIRRAKLVMDGVYGIEEFDRRADGLNSFLHYTGTPDYENKELGARRGVLVEDVRDVLSQFVPADDLRVVAFVVPNEKAPRSGRVVAGGK
jgi:predicted Zn-dependent peptidase